MPLSLTSIQSMEVNWTGITNQRVEIIGLITIVFHNGSNYVYHFIIKELVEKFEGQFHCLRENTVEKELKRISKNGEEIT